MENTTKSDLVEQQGDNADIFLDQFSKRHFESIKGEIPIVTLQDLKSLKEKGFTTEDWLNYIAKKHSVFFHGSVIRIAEENKLKSGYGIIFAASDPAIAIMRSLYSNRGATLEYYYRITPQRPLSLVIHTKPDGNYINSDHGYIYVVNRDGFVNEPEGSWQWKFKGEQKDFLMAVETEREDFKYPVTVVRDKEEYDQKMDEIYAKKRNR